VEFGLTELDLAADELRLRRFGRRRCSDVLGRRIDRPRCGLNRLCRQASLACDFGRRRRIAAQKDRIGRRVIVLTQAV
jgi:hypothetical protein